jgi:hypothetical protein
MLNENGVHNIVRNTRKLIPSGKEIDLYLPDYNVAIEVNGIFWHHDKIQGIDKWYHYNKYKECEAMGIQLITVFSSFLDKNKELIYNKILTKLGKNNVKKVHARKCEVVSLPIKDTKDILNKHHMQGYCASQIALGLKHDGDIVACMTFSKSRDGIGAKGVEGQYELVRYVTSCQVNGGASKLLNRFILDNNPAKITSYSDNCWGKGDMYCKLGFVIEKESTPNFWYLNPKTKELNHRYNYAKFKLVERGEDSNKTARQIMEERGFLRIWDCGTKTWSLDCHRKTINTIQKGLLSVNS